MLNNFHALRLGQIMCGSIMFKTHFGVFLDLDSRGTGLVLLPFFHDDPETAGRIWEQVQVGDVFCGVVIDFDDLAEKVGISRLSKDFVTYGHGIVPLHGGGTHLPKVPFWEEIVVNLQVGDIVRGTISSKRQYGVYVRFEKEGVPGPILGLITTDYLGIRQLRQQQSFRIWRKGRR